MSKTRINETSRLIGRFRVALQIRPNITFVDQLATSLHHQRPRHLIPRFMRSYALYPVSCRNLICLVDQRPSDLPV